MWSTMAWTGSGKPGIHGALLDTGSDGPDIRVAPRPSWLLIGMVIASTIGLLATTDDQVSNGYGFETAIDGGPAQLSASAPSAKFLIKVTVNALGAGDGDTSSHVRLSVHGTIVPSPEPLESGVFVDAQLSGRAATGAPPLSVLTQFDFGQDLPFFGDCAHPGGARACTAQTTLELSRDDAGAHGGVLNVAWNATFDGTAATKSKVDVPPAEPPPWTIDVTPL
jgi:hypothetical protein